MTTFKVGYLIGSLAKESINRKLATALTRLAPEHLAFTEIPIRDLPLYSYDYDADFPPPARAFKAAIAAVDAVLFVTPEYNYGPTPALLNALDYVYKEWNYKPAAFVSYGGISGGIRAVQVTKQTLTTLKMVPLVEAVVIPMVAQQLDENKQLRPSDVHVNSAKTMLDELLRWAEALKPMRAPA